MKYIRLIHDKRLSALSNTSTTLSIADISAKVSSVISFDIIHHEFTQPPQEILVNATSTNIFNVVGSIAIINVQTKSTLANIFYWELAHKCTVGNSIYIYEDSNDTCILDKSYYDNCFEKIVHTNFTQYRKCNTLPAEIDEGLDEWTFGIPVGPEDATFLNVVVERILSLDIPKKEILLCGRPNVNFKYFNHVRIVGEDIPAPPVLISTKKKSTSRRSHFWQCMYSS